MADPVIPRQPSSPTAGGIRGAVQVLVGFVVSTFIASHVDPYNADAVTVSMTALVTALLAAAGKYVRERYPNIPTPI